MNKPNPCDACRLRKPCILSFGSSRTPPCGVTAAATPDLLWSLKCALGVLDWARDHGAAKDATTAIIKQAKAAIALAEGLTA